MAEAATRMGAAKVRAAKMEIAAGTIPIDLPPRLLRTAQSVISAPFWSRRISDPVSYDQLISIIGLSLPSAAETIFNNRGTGLKRPTLSLAELFAQAAAETIQLNSFPAASPIRSAAGGPLLSPIELLTSDIRPSPNSNFNIRSAKEPIGPAIIGLAGIGAGNAGANQTSLSETALNPNPASASGAGAMSNPAQDRRSAYPARRSGKPGAPLKFPLFLQRRARQHPK